MIRKFYLMSLSLFCVFLSGCQMQEKASIHINKITPRTLTYNYILTHGMCMGYLRSFSPVPLTKLKELIQKDQNAKFYVILALAQPTRQNLQQAQYSIQQLLIAFE